MKSLKLVSKPSGRHDSTGNPDDLLVVNRVLKCPLRKSNRYLHFGLPLLILIVGMTVYFTQHSELSKAEDDRPLTAQSIIAADAENISQPAWNLPEGFQATILAGDELVHNAFCLTPSLRGPIAVSGPGYIRILGDRNEDGQAELIATFADGPRSGAQGLFFAGTDLLAVGDDGLLRYRDANADWHADGPPALLLPLKTGGEHHAHAIRHGPDGRWYLICGNMTFDPLPHDAAGGGVRSPEINDPHSPVTDPRAGLLLRFDYSSTEGQIRNLAVVADGMRNAYDFDFLRSGDIVTYDSDGEREVSLPWYRPTRVFRLLPGSDAGWFRRSWKRPSDFPAMPQTLAKLGRGSPTGVLVLRNSHWPEPFDNAIFVCDWTFGRVVAIPLDDRDQPGEPIAFLTAAGVAGFAPTDIVQTADGALVISCGGRGTTGRLVHVVPEEFADSTPAETTIADKAGEARADLRNGAVPARFHEQLTSKEPLLRRVALEALAGDSLGDAAFGTLIKPILACLTDESENVRRAAMNLVFRLSIERQAVLDRSLDEGGEIARIRFELGRTRGNRNFRPDLLEIAITAMDSGNLNEAASLDAVRLAQIALGDVGGTTGGGDTFSGYTPRASVAGNEALAPLVQRCAALFPTGHLAIDRELVRLLAMLAPDDPAVVAQLLAQITPASHPTNDLHRLFALARIPAYRSQQQTQATADALLDIDKKLAVRNLRRDNYWQRRMGDLLSELTAHDPKLWERIINLDEFGRAGHATLMASAPVAIRKQAAAVFLKKNGSDPEDWTPAVVSLIAELDTKSARRALHTAYEIPRLRSAALGELANRPQVADRDKFLAGLGAFDFATVSRCFQALKTIDAEAYEAEIAALARMVGRLDGNRGEYALRSRVVKRLQLLTGQDFGFDFGESGYRPQGEPVTRWRQYAQSLEPNTNLRNASEATILARVKSAARLEGNPIRGETRFLALACNRCHAGGVVGPELGGVTNRLSRKDLFRAIVVPNQNIPDRYRGILIRTTRGKVFTGLVAYESSDGVTLKNGQNTWRIPADRIAFRRPLEESLMPQGLLRAATAQEIADLEAYLKTLD